VTLGRPRLHLRSTTSTNDRARELATAGAPHGTVVTAGGQTAGRGRQGRAWVAPAGTALLVSVLLRDWPDLLPLRAGLAVADLAGPDAGVKWPNDVVVDGRKVAGILVEARPQEGWTVVGMGVNVAVAVADLPAELQASAGTLGRPPAALDAALIELLEALERWLAEPAVAVVGEFRGRDALFDRPITWADGVGVAAGIDDAGALLVRLVDGTVTALEAGEVHVSVV